MECDVCWFLVAPRLKTMDVSPMHQCSKFSMCVWHFVEHFVMWKEQQNIIGIIEKPYFSCQGNGLSSWWIVKWRRCNKIVLVQVALMKLVESHHCHHLCFPSSFGIVSDAFCQLFLFQLLLHFNVAFCARVTQFQKHIPSFCFKSKLIINGLSFAVCATLHLAFDHLIKCFLWLSLCELFSNHPHVDSNSCHVISCLNFITNDASKNVDFPWFTIPLNPFSIFVRHQC